MFRSDLINSFIYHRGFRSYLEIGVSDVAGNFAWIDCPRKVAVDPAPGLPGIDHRLTSDAFFRTCRETFDLIFIDGLHEDAQVGRDIRNALAHLNPGGVVVIHDCLPPDEWHQRPATAYRPGEEWNGTVWKAVLRHFAASSHDCYIIPRDWGCGVIDTARARTGRRFRLWGRLDYRVHFALTGQFLRDNFELRRLDRDRLPWP